jgi:hypothetical protein
VDDRAFFVVFALFAACALLDVMGHWLFWPWSYRLGLKVRSVRYPGLARPKSAVGLVVTTERARLKIVSPDQVLVRIRYRWFGQRETAGDLVARITWAGPDAVLDIGLSAAATALYLAGGPTVFALLSWRDGIDGPGFLLIAWPVMLVFAVVMARVGSGHLKSLVEEHWEIGTSTSRIEQARQPDAP